MSWWPDLNLVQAVPLRRESQAENSSIGARLSSSNSAAPIWIAVGSNVSHWSQLLWNGSCTLSARRICWQKPSCCTPLCQSCIFWATRLAHFRRLGSWKIAGLATSLIIFTFTSTKKSLISLEGKLSTPPQGEKTAVLLCFSQRLPSLGSCPLKDFLNWHGAHQGLLTLSCALLLQLQRNTNTAK